MFAGVEVGWELSGATRYGVELQSHVDAQRYPALTVAPNVAGSLPAICNLLGHRNFFTDRTVGRSCCENRPGRMKSKINNAAMSASTVTVALSTLAFAVSSLPALAKTPGATYCINSVCHRVKTVDEVKAEIGLEVTQAASFYDRCEVDPHNPCTPLSSGEEFHADRPDNAASPIYPNGTVLALVNPKTNATAVVRINNSGPYFKGRLLDVSRATAVQLGFLDAGIAQLKVTVVSRGTAIVAPTTGK